MAATCAPIHAFTALEALLDAKVGETLRLEVERGGAPIEAEVTVRDLHAITPATFLEFGGAILHDLSYQLARQFQIPLRGVYLLGFTPLYELGWSFSL